MEYLKGVFVLVRLTRMRLYTLPQPGLHPFYSLVLIKYSVEQCENTLSRLSLCGHHVVVVREEDAGGARRVDGGVLRHARGPAAVL